MKYDCYKNNYGYFVNTDLQRLTKKKTVERKFEKKRLLATDTYQYWARPTAAVCIKQ